MLRGQKVLLREKRQEDAYADYRWRTDEELARLDATIPLKLPLTEFLTYYAEELEYPTPRRRRFAIESLEDNKHIGNCMYYDISFNAGEAELGIMIGDKDYWGKGYGEDAVNTLVDHIFDTVKLKRIYLHTLEWNVRAQMCFQRCGFQPYAHLKRNKRKFIAMEILRENWERRRNPQPAGQVDAKA